MWIDRAQQKTVEEAAHEAYEAAHHFHNKDRTFGISASQAGNDWALEATLNPYHCISGSGDFGGDANDEAKLFGTDDTPFEAGKKKFDVSGITVQAASNATDWVLRVIWGSGTMADAEAAGQYSDTRTLEARKGAFATIRTPRLVCGVDQVWVKGKNASDNATLDLFADMHEYDK